LMEKGIRNAKAFRRLEHAKLQLGYAHHLAGSESEGDSDLQDGARGGRRSRSGAFVG